nr:hypothetical protein [Tanacetum cinerariifolium]
LVHKIVGLVVGKIDARFLVYLRQLLVGRAGGEAEGQGKKGRFQEAEGGFHAGSVCGWSEFGLLVSLYTAVMLSVAKHLYRTVG